MTVQELIRVLKAAQCRSDTQVEIWLPGTYIALQGPNAIPASFYSKERDALLIEGNVVKGGFWDDEI